MYNHMIGVKMISSDLTILQEDNLLLWIVGTLVINSEVVGYLYSFVRWSSRMTALLLYHLIASCTSKDSIGASAICHLWSFCIVIAKVIGCIFIHLFVYLLE